MAQPEVCGEFLAGRREPITPKVDPDEFERLTLSIGEIPHLAPGWLKSSTRYAMVCLGYPIF